MSVHHDQHRHEHHVYVHLAPMTITLAPTPPRRRRRQRGAVTAILAIGGSLMPANISIDSTTGDADIFWVDSHGDTDAAAPEGAQVAFTSDNPDVATIDPDSGHITPVAEGTTNIGADITGADDGPLLEPDGTTPFAVEPSEITIVAGAAVGVGLEIKS